MFKQERNALNNILLKISVLDDDRRLEIVKVSFAMQKSLLLLLGINK